jgi:hypothetical protein
VAHFWFIASTGSKELTSLVASLAALLATAGMLATALLMSVALRLLDLSAAAMPDFASRLADLAHVVTILNHVRAAQAICLVSILYHT